MPDNKRYDKYNILEKPILLPDRSYETDGYLDKQPIIISEDIEQDNDLLETLEQIDTTYNMCNILPDEIKVVLQDILQVLSEETQAQIIERIENTFYSPNIYIPDQTEPDVPYIDIDVYVEPDINLTDDIFSSEPSVVVETEAVKSMIDLSQEAFKKDNTDLKAHYVGKIQEMTHRYFQIMSSLAVDCNVPDFTYLNKYFDSESVVVDNNSLHLKDHITKSQIIRDQKQRIFNKSYTTDKTLILTRSWLAAEKQRERYLAETYKTPNSLSSTMSNDLLLMNRDESDERYNTALYNNYKYLNSSVIISSDILDMQINEAQAKSQLIKEGVDIYASSIDREIEKYESEVIATTTAKKTLSEDDINTINNILKEDKSVTASSISSSNTK